MAGVIDLDTDAVAFTPKYAPTGWHQQLFELEFETCQIGSIHEKDYLDNDIGWASLQFYDSVGNSLTDQASIDANCVRTDLTWVPDTDYMIKGGMIGQISAPTVDIYAWAMAVPDLGAYGIQPAVFTDGGINLRFQNAYARTGLDGVSGTVLKYHEPALPSPADYGETNKMRFVIRHPVGHKHRLQVMFDIFVP